MKKTIAFLLAVSMLLCLCACGADTPADNNDKGGDTTATEQVTTTTAEGTTTGTEGTTTTTEGATTGTEGTTTAAPTTGTEAPATTTQDKTPTKTEGTTTTTTQPTTTTTTQPEEPEDTRPTIKILSIGHSFSVDAMKTYMWSLFEAAGYNATIGYLYYPGCSLERQYHYVKDDTPSYERYSKNINGGWVDKAGACATDALYDEDWDIVTFQPSPDYGKGTMSYKCQWGCNKEIENDYVHFDQLVNLVKKKLASVGNTDVQFYYHLTWAFAADCKLWSFAYSDWKQMTMYRDFLSATRTYVTTNSEIKGVIPCATSIQNIRTSWMGDTFNEPSFDANGKASDGYHLNDKGDLVAAMTWVAFFTGKSATEFKIGTKYSDAEYAAIAESVDNAIATPWAVTRSTYKTEP